MSIGDNIRKYRQIKKITQTELATLSFCSESSIRKYERGIRIPGSTILNRIAASLDVSINDLIGNNEYISSYNDLSSFDKLNYLGQYIMTLGYQIDGDYAEGYLWLKTPNGTYEIEEKNIEELATSTKSFIEFKLHEIIKKSRKIGK